MSNPYRIDGPALISFSGGRTSGYMLRQILDAHSGTLPDDYRVAFANTGKERPETLDFVQKCGSEWGVDIAWLEYRSDGPFARVTYETASRNGEPFTALMRKRNYLPNPVTRFCTQEMKICVIRDYMRAEGFDYWNSIVGIRADEPRRVARMRAPNSERWDNAVPLADAGVTVDDVSRFWRGQSFDLRLRPWEGNCDLCFLKGRAKKERIMIDNPDLASWWIDAEAEARSSKPSGALFRADQPSYAAMLRNVQSQQVLALDLDACSIDDLEDCLCAD